MEDNFSVGQGGSGGWFRRSCERWGAAEEASLAPPPLTYCCAARCTAGYRSVARGLGTPALRNVSERHHTDQAKESTVLILMVCDFWCVSCPWVLATVTLCALHCRGVCFSRSVSMGRKVRVKEGYPETNHFDHIIQLKPSSTLSHLILL